MDFRAVDGLETMQYSDELLAWELASSELRLGYMAGRKARKLRNRLASAIRIDMETWLGLTLWSFGRVCEIPSQVAYVQLLRTPTKFLGLLRGMETENAVSQCSFVLEVQFWSYSFMWEVAKCDMHNHGII